MTDQSQEILIYRGERFLTFDTPLSSFLEQNKQVQFDLFTTAHWRGYQGYWLLQNDKLYITNLESSNHTLKDIFNSEGPILAEWYSGILEFEFGVCYFDHSSGYYNTAVWLKLEQGKVIDKKIIQKFNNTYPITFGKYKGKKLDDLLFGKVKYNTYSTIKNLIDSLLLFISQKNYPYKVQCGYFNIEQKDIELVKDVREYGIEYFLTQNYIATSTKVFWENSNNDDRAEKLSILLEKMFQSDFYIQLTLTKPTLGTDAEVAENSVLINPDINYINWALLNVNFFTINPIDLSKTFNLKHVVSFKTKRLNKTIFEYEPIIEDLVYKFPEQTQVVNQQKFEKENSVIFDTENRILIPNLTTEELMLRYGYYLDENYTVPVKIEKIIKNSPFRNDYYNSDDWLIDAAGTDDPETMNDVYWNLD